MIKGKKERQLQWFLTHIEGYIGEVTAAADIDRRDVGNKFFIGNRPSLADAVLFNALGEHAPEIEGTGGEPYGDLAAMTAVLAKYPKIKAVVEHFKQSPGMEYYLATRAPQKW